ncbi:hypothetical protein POM88_042853 [Heracleum sosnowskyi]|uniref:ATP-dependent DNA helicase n=1 Tax=Heracleum sosnowskyi TaxID=360622 RepID=A0AAD8MC25_9APIA|nr:hypothetical protein POM88_042853 [Heracleum sosnowskyi]
MRHKDVSNLSRPFGGKTVLLGGDFRQILPVLPKKGREDIVMASINKSYLWDDCKVFKLDKNMRIESGVPPVTISGQKIPYADWVIGVGDGHVPTFASMEGNEPCWIEIPPELNLCPENDGKKVIVDTIYAHMCESSTEADYFRDRAILTPLNEDVDAINKEVLKRFTGIPRLIVLLPAPQLKIVSNFIQSYNMGSYKLLKDLKLGEGTQSIKVRVSREWGGRKPGSAHVTVKNYLLLDEEGTQLHALTTEYSLISFFAKKMKVGNVYMISKYDVEDAPEIYRPVPGKYVIKLYRKTEVTDPGNIPAIPMYKFEIATFQNARSREGDVVTLMDIVGKLTKSTPIQITNNGKKALEIELTNESNDNMKIVLWENQAHDFLQYKIDCEKPDVFLLVTGTTAKLVKGEHVQWSSSSTNFFFNIDHPTIVSLRASMKGELIPKIVSSIKTHAQSTIEEIERVAIQQLFDAQLPEGKNDIAFIIEATILELIPIYGGWYYMGCKKCGKIVNEMQECTNCPNNKAPPVPLYRVTAEVEDSTSSTTVVLFDKHVMKLINVSAQHILTNDKNATQEMIPAVLNNMLGKKCILQLKLTSFNTVRGKERYTVTQAEEVKPTEVNNVQVVPTEQLEHGDTQTVANHQTENKRKSLEVESDHLKPPASSAVKESNGKQTRTKRQK